MQTLIRITRAAEFVLGRQQVALRLTTTYLLPDMSFDLRLPIELEFSGTVVVITAPPPVPAPGERVGAIAQVQSSLDDPAIEAELGGLVVPIDFESLSLSLQAASATVATVHLDAVRRAVQLLRWRLGAVGGHREILGSQGTTWESDGGATGWFPGKASLTTSSYALVAPGSLRHEIERSLSLGRSEPLAHSLLREAREQLTTNPRSSLVIGIAAFEIGVKNYVALAAPATRWLIDELPSPPVVKILADYVPTLPGRTGPGRIIRPPSRRLKKILGDAVAARNKLAHVGASPPDRATLRTALEAIRDVLYYLDYLAGESWAADRVTSETRLELGI